MNALEPGLIATRPGHVEPVAKKRRDDTVPWGRGGVLVQQRSPQVEVFGLDRYPRVAGSLFS